MYSVDGFWLVGVFIYFLSFSYLFFLVVLELEEVKKFYSFYDTPRIMPVSLDGQFHIYN